ncbi:MAG: twitch domain-containing radical SAM protein [Chitinophagales bacterium]|nr:twitch domain-containing radical SAM protein [Chitinophagales bacterium]MDW8418400.1 twitch domain-containing radical SAM protein [Chitinophagales bacterium]
MDILEHFRTLFTINRKIQQARAAGYDTLDLRQYRRYNRFRPLGAKPIFCYVPFNSLTFSFSGKVFACSYNRDVLLGKYPEQSIDEIWNSPEAKQLRQFMLHNDLNYGCQHCRYFFEKGKFSNLKPLVFDKYYQNTAATFPQVMEFELSNECNLECQMCVGEVSSSIRKNRDKLPPIPMPYDDLFLTQLAKYIPHLKEAKFYGGEPFLISIYYKIWDLIRQLNPRLPLFVITNGTHWNAKIESIIRDLNFEVAISIDATDKQLVERIRKNIQYEKLMENIRRFNEVCRRKGKYLSLSFTVQQENWHELPQVIHLCNELGAYIFISYLERPAHFSIAEYPTEKLKEILRYMGNIALPKKSPAERHNYQCFEDFKHYIQTYINNPDEKRYLDYRFENILLQNEDPVLYRKRTAIVIDKSYTEADVLGALSEAIVKNSEFSELNMIALTDKLRRVVSKIDDREDKIYGLMMKGTPEQIINSLKNYSEDELVSMLRESLEKAVIV